MNPPQLDIRTIGNIDQTAVYARAENLFDGAGHACAGFSGADHLNSIECGKEIAVAAGAQRASIKSQMTRDRLFGVRGIQCRAKYLLSVPAYGRGQNRGRSMILPTFTTTSSLLISR